MSHRCRFLLFLICAVVCAVVYFMYILNSDKASRYDLDETAVRSGYSPTRDRLRDSIEKDLSDVVLWGKDSSHPVRGVLDEAASTLGDQLIGRHDDLDVPKVSSAEIRKRVPLNRRLASDALDLSRKYFQGHSGIDGRESDGNPRLERSSYEAKNSIDDDSSEFKPTYTNKSLNRIYEPGTNGKNKPEISGIANETLRGIEDSLVNRRRKEESLSVDEGKILEDGSIVGFHEDVVVHRSRHPIDPSNWEGLNNTVVESRFPGLVLLEGYRRGRPFVAPEDASAVGMQGSPQTLSEMLDSQAEERFFQLISERHLSCIMIQRMGNPSDGGWDVCTVPPYDLKPECIVYSFGINYDFTFDDAMATNFDCTVKSFDPSMSVGDHVRSARVHFYQLGLGAQNTVTSNGWKLNTFRHIRKKLGHDKSAIDILKIDIEFYEWECLHSMIVDRSLASVKQLIFEMHTPEVSMVKRPATKEDFANMYHVLSDLERAGFRRYNVHMNPLGQYTSSRTGKTRSCCFELSYVNIRFLKLN